MIVDTTNGHPLLFSAGCKSTTVDMDLNINGSTSQIEFPQVRLNPLNLVITKFAPMVAQMDTDSLEVTNPPSANLETREGFKACQNLIFERPVGTEIQVSKIFLYLRKNSTVIFKDMLKSKKPNFPIKKIQLL